MTNCLSPGDKVLAARFGQFSHLWIDMCQRLGFEVEIIDCEWGTGVPVGAATRPCWRPTRSHKIKAVLACHNETATGVTSDIAAVRRAIDAAQPPGAAVRRRGQLARQHRFPHGRVGRGRMRVGLAEGPDAAGRAWA